MTGRVVPTLQLIKRCPVSGAELTPGDDWGNLIYMSLCMDQGSGHTLQVRSTLCTLHEIAFMHTWDEYCLVSPRPI